MAGSRGEGMAKRVEDAVEGRQQRLNRAKDDVGLLRQQHRDDGIVLDELRHRFERRVQAYGAGAGGMAVVPGLGTAIALAAVATDLASFAHEATHYLTCVAYVRGLDPREPHVALALRRVVTSTIRGHVEDADGSVIARARRAAGSTTAATGLKHGARIAARTLPFGGGAVLGGALNTWMARRLIADGDRVVDGLLADGHGVILL